MRCRNSIITTRPITRKATRIRVLCEHNFAESHHESRSLLFTIEWVFRSLLCMHCGIWDLWWSKCPSESVLGQAAAIQYTAENEYASMAASVTNWQKQAEAKINTVTSFYTNLKNNAALQAAIDVLLALDGSPSFSGMGLIISLLRTFSRLLQSILSRSLISTKLWHSMKHRPTLSRQVWRLNKQQQFKIKLRSPKPNRIWLSAMRCQLTPNRESTQARKNDPFKLNPMFTSIKWPRLSRGVQRQMSRTRSIKATRPV